jgi:hypothetical protein
MAKDLSKEIRHHKDGSVSEVTADPGGFYRHKNLTPGKGMCVFCGGPLDADADMVAHICTPCWDETCGEEE